MNPLPPTLFLLFNHTLTVTQEADARRSLGVERIIVPPIEVADLWVQVPPDSDGLTGYLAPVFSWLAETSWAGDFVLIQGEFGHPLSFP